MKKFLFPFILLCIILSLQINAQTLTVQLTASQFGSYNISCNGANNGTISISLTDGTAPYTLFGRNDTIGNWNVLMDSLNSSSVSFNNMQPGSYYLMVTDSLNDTAYANITLTQPSALEITLYSPSYSNFNIHCSGGNDGEILANVTGGITPYSYLWSNDSVSSSINALRAGIYSVTVTDGAGCSTTSAKTLTEPAALSSSVTSGLSQLACYGQNTSIDLSVIGGAIPYTYTWSSGHIGEDIASIGAGTYSVRIDDNNGCFTYDTILITEPSLLELTGAAQTYPNGYNISCHTCADGQYTLSVTGGSGGNQYAYRTSGQMVMLNGNTTLTGMYADTLYHFFTMDAAGCMDSLEVSFSRPPIPVPALVVDLFPKTYIGNYNISQHGATDGSIEVKASGGVPPYTVLWNTGSTAFTLNNLSAGNYSVTITDAANTTASDSITLSEPSGALEVFLVATQPGCNNPTGAKIESYVIGGTPPYTYHWTSTSGVPGFNTYQTLNNPAAGDYTLLVVDANEDSVTAAATIQSFISMSVSISSNTNAYGFNVNCYNTEDGTINLTVTGGVAPYDFWWNDGVTTQNRTGLKADFYSVNVKDSTGCDMNAGITLTSPPQMGMNINPFMYGNGLPFSCDTCNDAQVTAMPYGGIPPYSILWNTGETSPTLSNIYADSLIYITITDAAGCVFQDSGHISRSNMNQNQPLMVNAYVSSYPTTGNVSCMMCSDGYINLTVTGSVAPYTYSWSNGATTQNIDSLSTGFYSVTVTSANGALVTQSYNIMFNPPPPPPMGLMIYGTTSMFPGTGNVSCANCADGYINLNVSGGMPPYTFMWNNGATTQNISGIDTGYYAVTVTDFNGAMANQGFYIMAYSIPPPMPLAVNYTTSFYPGGYGISCSNCADGWINLMVSGGMPPYQFWWEDNTMEQSPNRYTLSGGMYHARIQDMNGDSAHVYVSLLAPSNQLSVSLQPYFGGCGTMMSGQINAQVNGGTPPYYYQWSGPMGPLPDNFSSAYITQPGTYYITVTDANNSAAQANVNVVAPPSLNVWLDAPQQHGTAHTGCTVHDGKIYIHLNGGQPPYNVNVNGNLYAQNNNNNSGNNGPMPGNGFSRYFYTSDTLLVIDSLAAGNYWVNVNDMSNCQSGSNVEIRQTEPPRISVGGTEYENGYYFSCDSCHDAQMSAAVTGGFGNLQYHWFEIPQEYASMALKGASLFMSENKDFNINNLPPAVSASQTATIANAETLHVLVVADELGCVGFTNFTLEKPKPVTGWHLKGNVVDSTFILGSVNTEDLRIATNDTVRMIVRAGGDVEVKNDINIMGDLTLTNMSSGINCANLLGVNTSGRIIPITLQDQCLLNLFNNTNSFWKLGGNNATDTSFIGTISNTDFRIHTNDSLRMVVKNTGEVLIGTNTVPEGYMFAVNGKAIATEMEVKLYSDWPDYVFGEDYKLLPLEELKQNIDKHGHLPGMPSADEVKKKGINLGEMDALLLQKVEELTLYMLQLQQQNKELQKKVDELSK